MDEELYDRPQKKNAFLDFLLKVWSAKITLAVTFGVTALVVGLGMGVVLNNLNGKYVTEVVYMFPGAESGRYADGTTYNYMNNVSYANLSLAKESDPSFATIDILKMSSKSDISVVPVTETETNGEEKYSLAHLKYTVSAKYFASYSQARLFLDYLTELPANKAATIAKTETYNYSLNASKVATSYDSQISHLSAQYNLINNGYQSVLESYGNSVVYASSTGGSLLVLESYLLFQNYFATHSIGTLKEVLANSGFVKATDTDAKAEAEARIIEIDRAIEQNTIEIDALTEKYKEIYKGDSTTGASPFAGRIQELITQNTALAKEKEYLERKLANLITDPTPEEKAKQQAFEGLLSNTTAALEGFVSEYTTMKRYVQSKNITTTYAQSSHTTSSGSFAWYICTIAAVAAGLALGLFVAYFKGLHNCEKALAVQKS